MTQSRGFFSKLFDFSFSQFVAIQIVGIVYGIGIVLAGLTALGAIISGFSNSLLAGLGAVVISPIIFLVYVIFFRLGLEAFIASIRTAENTRRMAENMRNP